MPYTRTWSEELIAEWLQLKGYFVEISVPIRTAEPGGRPEADVLGIRIRDRVLEIMHVEVGSLPGGTEKNIQHIQKKFSSVNQKAIEEYCRKKLGFDGKASYENLYIATYVSKETIEATKKNNINIKHLDSFIKEDVIPAIDDWKEKPPFKPKTKGTTTLPDGLWLLHLVEKMMDIQLKR
ncbi:MAG: hypothetical protein QXQ94_08830 [Candidatus Bathyarchaeia archaeon]